MTTQVDMVCEFGVLKALEAAGKRGRLPRSTMGKLMQDGVPNYAVHTRVLLAQTPGDCDRLLAGAWDIMREVLPEATSAALVQACTRYTTDLLLTRKPFDRGELDRHLAAARATLPV